MKKNVKFIVGGLVAVVVVVTAYFGTGGNFLQGKIGLKSGNLSLAIDPTSPKGGIVFGSSDKVLGTFTLMAPDEDIELRRIALDFSNGANRMISQDTKGYFDCTSKSCDMSGTVKVVTSKGKALYVVPADNYHLWNNFSYQDELSSYYTIPAGTTETINIVGSINSNPAQLGFGEQLKVDIRNLYYYKKASYETASTQPVFGNLLNVVPKISFAKDLTSPSGNISLGASDQVLGSFRLKVNESVELQKIALDFTGGNGYRGGSQDTTGYFECATGTGKNGCDLSGSIKVVTDSGKVLLTVKANNPSLWNNTPVMLPLSSYYKLTSGSGVTLKIIGTIASNAEYTGVNESVIVGVAKIGFTTVSGEAGETGSAYGNSLVVSGVK